MKLHVSSIDSELEDEALLKVRNLKVWFPIKSGVIQRTVGYVRAVDGVSFNVRKGETLGIVGESGSGKTTLGKSILRLVKPTSGEIHFNGIDIVKAKRSEMKQIRRSIQMIFQDPYASLDPRQTVSSILYEAMKIHGVVKNKVEALEKAVKLLETVGLSEEHLYRFPHEFSGGQRQRIA
ncbi:MAG: dipeptide/oligopeptide/nickel ABC transporter ATP-binding protein, partial [Candidatus Bathyarchaeia archaeon]